MFRRYVGRTWKSAAMLPLLVGLGATSRAETSTQVVDLLPRGADRAQAKTSTSQTLGRPVTFVELEPGLIDALRWATPDPATTSCRETASELIRAVTRTKRVPPPPDAAGLPAALIAQAEVQVRALDLKEALTSLKLAREYLPCAASLVTPEQVRALFQSEALAHLFLLDGKQDESFRSLLAIEPALKVDRGAPATVRDAIKVAAKEVRKVSPLQVDAGELPGAVYVDGRRLEPGFTAYPGVHLVQVERAGELRTGLVTLSGQNAVRLSAVVTFGLPGVAETRERLARSLLTQTMEPVFTRAVDRLLNERGQTTLTFVVGAEEPVIKVYRAGLGLASDPTAGPEPAGTPAADSRPAR